MIASVVIPVYNRASELRRALKSVLSQTVRDLEVIVVDDCSETDLKSVTDAFGDNRIKYFRLEKKGYANVCRNLGIKNASGKYIAMLDSDDEWLPHHLESKLKVLEAEKADGVFGSIVIDDTEKQQPVYSRPIQKGELMINYLFQEAGRPHPHMYTKRSARGLYCGTKHCTGTRTWILA